MMKFIAPFLILAASMLFGGPAEAQSFVVGVTACGTAPTTIVNGRPAYLTVDLNGNLCPAASGGGTPVTTNITQWASVALGAPSAYGTSPGAVIVPGVNAFVTNFPATQPVSGTVTANQGTANATPWPVSLTSTTVTGNVTVVGPTADGSPAATPPVLIGGTVDGSASGNVGVAKVDAAGLAYNAITNWGGTALGAMANYGTSPGAVLVPGVNAFVTNTVTVTGTVATTEPVGITPTDRTVTSATGSSQTMMALNATRHSLTIENTGNANCGVNPTGGTAAIGGAGTLTLAPLGAYTPRVPTLSAVTVICTAGQPIYGDEN